MPIYWDYTNIFGRPRRCHHRCDCGAELFNCGGDPDKCVIGEHYTCPSCEQDALDAFLERTAREIRERAK